MTKLSTSCPRITANVTANHANQHVSHFFFMQCSILDLSLKEVLSCPTFVLAGNFLHLDSAGQAKSMSCERRLQSLQNSGAQERERQREKIYHEGMCGAPWFSWAEIQTSEFSPAPGCRSFDQFHLWACVWACVEECMKPDVSFKHQVFQIIQNTCKSPMLHFKHQWKKMVSSALCTQLDIGNVCRHRTRVFACRKQASFDSFQHQKQNIGWICVCSCVHSNGVCLCIQG